MKTEADPFKAQLEAMMMGGAMGRRNTGESVAAKPKAVETDASGRDFFGYILELVGPPKKLEAISEIEFMPQV